MERGWRLKTLDRILLFLNIVSLSMAVEQVPIVAVKLLGLETKFH